MRCFTRRTGSSVRVAKRFPHSSTFVALVGAVAGGFLFAATAAAGEHYEHFDAHIGVPTAQGGYPLLGAEHRAIGRVQFHEHGVGTACPG